MYTTTQWNEVHQYPGINEEDAYHIALQVLDEMQVDTKKCPECFKNDSFSPLYNWLIYKVLGTADLIEEARK